MSGAGSPAPRLVEDFYGVVQLHSDGSVVRGDESVLMPAGPFPDVPGVQWKDVVYDAARGLKVRVYRPPQVTAGGTAEGDNKLPVLVYFHGGGYCIGAYDQPMFHSCCQGLAAALPAVVLSVQYRRAPEHRLPAAIEDAAAFFSWLLRAQAGADPWLVDSADLSRTFVSGVSAGANLSHHVVARIASGQIELGAPARLAGYVLLSAFFGSDERVGTETDPPPDVSLTVEASDQLWRMALPVGATRDHPLANPFGPDSPSLEALPLPPALVVAPGRDVLRDHVLRYAARLKGMGKAVELAEFAGERHGFSCGQRSPATEELMRILKRFVDHGVALSLHTLSLRRLPSTTMSSDNAAPHVVEDFFGVVQLLSDGSVVRGDESVLMPAGPFPDVPGVQWKDAVYDAARGLKVRVYRPSTGGGGKLPVLVYFHGGGYCMGAYDQPMFHSCCQRFAAELPAVVASVQYRLAPEHRLPAAVEDGATFLSWLRGQAALGAEPWPWLAESADFARTFVSGVSAGANLAHHVVVQVASGQLAVDPVRVAGYVLLSAFFGSAERTATESGAPATAVDQLWRMVLPEGATRDHPLANPFGPDSPGLEPLPLPPVLVVAPGLDTLRGHMRRYASRLKEIGKAVELAEFAGEQHGFSVRGWSEANEELVRIMRRFVNQGAAPS
ncbi:hypothetical protein BS78_03G060400 [Paspalum vaginatum]|nr:hypothetical protein BS78_03G060400 [Paspalum vaginatum]